MGSCDGEDGGDDALSVGRVGPRYAGSQVSCLLAWNPAPSRPRRSWAGQPFELVAFPWDSSSRMCLNNSHYDVKEELDRNQRRHHQYQQYQLSWLTVTYRGGEPQIMMLHPLL